MWISNKNNQIINLDKVKYLNILKGKNYYDDDAVLQTYHYICADGVKIIKLSNERDAFIEFNSIKQAILDGHNFYDANGIEIAEDELGNITE